MSPKLEKLLAAFFSLFFPDNCRICQKPLKDVSRAPVCPSCLAAPEPLLADYFCVDCGTPFVNPHPLKDGRCGLCRLGTRGFDAAYSYGAYEGALRKLIHLYKYGRVAALADPLGRLLAGAIPLDQRFDAVVPVPLHWRRRLSRGFNQAELLGRRVAARYAVPLVRAARRKRSTATQAGLSNPRRRANVAGAFTARSDRRIRGKRVLLVDDVFTTGATASACAAALKRAGARYVAVLTLARVDRRWAVEPFAATRTAAAGAP